MQANSPAFFKQGPKPLTLLVVYGVLSLVLLVGDYHFRTLGWVRQQVSVLLYPLQWLATAPVAGVHRAGQFLSDQASLQAEVRHLKDKELLAASQLLRMQSIEAENNRLQALLAAQIEHREQGHATLVEVLYHGRDPFVSKLIVDRGELSGVKAGQVVIDPHGVVGQVTRLQPLTAEITLLTDKQHAVPVQVLRNGLRTVVFGMGREHPLEVRFMPINSDIQPGDQLVASGIDGVYPAGLPVAKVLHVDRNTGSAFARVLAAPMADVDKQRFFLILDERRVLPAKPAEPAPEAKPGKKGRKN